MFNAPDYIIDKKVKIACTEFDRRRALTDDEQDYAKYLYTVKHYTLTRIAEIMDMSVPGIYYIVNEDYRERKKRANKNYAHNNQSSEDAKEQRDSRIKYKRSLIKLGLIKEAN